MSAVFPASGKLPVTVIEMNFFDERLKNDCEVDASAAHQQIHVIAKVDKTDCMW